MASAQRLYYQRAFERMPDLDITMANRYIVAIIVFGVWVALGVLFLRVPFNPRAKRTLFPLLVVIGSVLFLGMGFYVVGNAFPWPLWAAAIIFLAFIDFMNIAQGRICLGCGRYFQVPLLKKATHCPKCRQAGEDVIDVASSSV